MRVANQHGPEATSQIHEAITVDVEHVAALRRRINDAVLCCFGFGRLRTHWCCHMRVTHDPASRLRSGRARDDYWFVLAWCYFRRRRYLAKAHSLCLKLIACA